MADEPDFKRARMNDKMMIRAVLSDEYTDDVKMSKAIIGRISDIKLLSKIMAQLSVKLPLNGLQHLKRVKQNEVIICEQSAVTSNDVNAEVKTLFDQTGISGDMFSTFVAFTVQEVPANPPKLRHHYEIASSYWGCKFHPNHYMEKMFKNEMFSEQETTFHIEMMEICLTLSNCTISKASGLAVNPKIKRIAALGVESTHNHPLQHCPLVLIDLVAVSQNGGAWNTGDPTANTTEWNFQGCDKKWIDTISKLYPTIEFGAQPIVSNIIKAVDSHDDNLGKYGPYLCTGYDLYFTDEPCTMCAMALIHSRARRIFYHKSTDKGALGSLLKLHTVAGLNHHYEVFQIS